MLAEKIMSGLRKMLGVAKAGYEYDFVEEVPDELVCPICHLPTRDPQQVVCCGKIYCAYCLGQTKRVINRCPTCRNSISSFSDQVSSRRILGLSVKCPNEKFECPWVGTCGEVERHTAKCRFAKLPCSLKCGAFLFSEEMDDHFKECPCRLHRCPHCRQTGQYRVMTTSHLRVCPELEVQCPNKDCLHRTLGKNIFFHRKQCPHENVGCQYRHVGCTFVTTREKMQEHESECTQQHLTLAMKALSTANHTAPLVIRMKHFKEHKDAGIAWHSPGFYSHQGGYKLCLNVEANGYGTYEGTHISVYTYLMKGTNDANLVWPFQADIFVVLLNQLKNEKHHEKVWKYTHKTLMDYNQRIMTDSEISDNAFGIPKFVSHSTLVEHSHQGVQYLKDNSLCFKVVVKVNDACRPWLTPAISL